MGEFRDKAKGRIKQAVGALANKPGLKREGRADELKGQVEGKLADLKQAAKHVAAAVKSTRR